MKLNQITGAMLNQAVAIYMENAYRGRKPETRIVPCFPPEQTMSEILAKPGNPFEDLSGSAQSVTGGAARVFALRLGNMSYPHMKLALVEAFYGDEFFFTVDRHDTFNFEPGVPGYEAWCELKELNRLFKEAIEEAWHRAGLPTLQGLREKQQREAPPSAPVGRGRAVLILDDDVARAGVLSEILQRQGCVAVVGPSSEPPEEAAPEYLEAMKRAKGESVRLPAKAWAEPPDVNPICTLIARREIALVILDVSYWTGQGPRIASALRLDARSQDAPILGIYSRRDLGLDPDVFSASLRRPYRAEALVSIVTDLLKGGR